MSKIILITGATGGIGSALARSYAAPSVCLILAGRNELRLSEIAQMCRDKGAEVVTYSGDVNHPSFLTWIQEIAKTRLPDLVIANAGISSTTGPNSEAESLKSIEKVINTNVVGVIRVITPIIAEMRKRKRGQVALMSSIAALTPLPDCPAYCASKAALKIYGESLRIFLQKDGVKINVICPGFVETAMNQILKGPKPFIMSADKAASIIKKGLSRDKPVIVFPKKIFWLVMFSKMLPRCVIAYFLKRTNSVTRESYLGE